MISRPLNDRIQRLIACDVDKRGEVAADRIGRILGNLTCLAFETHEQFMRRVGHVAIAAVAEEALPEYLRETEPR